MVFCLKVSGLKVVQFKAGADHLIPEGMTLFFVKKIVYQIILNKYFAHILVEKNDLFIKLYKKSSI